MSAGVPWVEAGVHGALRLVPRAAPPPSWLWARVFPDPEGAGSASLDGRPPCPRPSGAFRSSGQPPALPTLSVICRFPLLLRVEVCFLTASRAPGLHLSVAAPPISLLAGGELKDPSLSSASLQGASSKTHSSRVHPHLGRPRCGPSELPFGETRILFCASMRTTSFL